MSWKKVRLGDLLTESKIESIKSDPNKRITVRLNFKGVEKRPFEKGVEGGTKYYIRKAGQFIYGKQNLFKGAFGLVPEELDGFESSQDIPTFDISKKCLPEWLIYFLRQGNFYQSLESIATGTGSRRIQPARLFNVDIPLPNINEQRKLICKIHEVEKLYNALSRELEKQQAYLQEIKKTILQESLMGKIVKQNNTDESATELLNRIRTEKEKLISLQDNKKLKFLPQITKEEIPYNLPAGWLWCRLGDIGQINPRNNFADDKEVSFVPMSLISSEFGVSPKFEQKKWKEVKHSFTHFAENDVAVAKITPCFENSKAGIFKGLINGIGAGTTELHVFRGNVNLILPDYIYFYFKSPDFLREGESKMTGSAGQKRIPSDFIKNSLFPLPPIAEQQRIVDKVHFLQNQIKQIETSVFQSKKYALNLLQSVLQQHFKV